MMQYKLVLSALAAFAAVLTPAPACAEVRHDGNRSCLAYLKR